MVANKPPVDVLIVEDNQADSYLTQEAMHVAEPSCVTTIIADGESAIDHLSRHRPDIVVLDLNIPRRDGVEVLRFIRNQEELDGVVVVIFSSSPKDAIERKAPQADAHIQKPFDLEIFLQVGIRIMTCFRHRQPKAWRAPLE
jgi:CheY-like chemotaxis protein